MILVDTNLLVYASVAAASQHEKAKLWLDNQLNGASSVGIPWASLFRFLRIVTNHRIFNPPTSAKDAWGVVEYWLDCSPVWIPQPAEKHRQILARLYDQTSPQGNLVPDTHLAALAIEHGLTIFSTDRDFSRFPEVKWQNPLLTTELQ